MFYHERKSCPVRNCIYNVCVFKTNYNSFTHLFIRMEVDQGINRSFKSETTDFESNSSPRNNSYVVKQQGNDSPRSMTVNHVDSNEKFKKFHADIVADKTKSQLSRNSINAIDQEIYSIYNRDNFKIKKNTLSIHFYW